MNRFDVLVLGALSRAKAPSESELAKAVQPIADPDASVGAVRVRVVEALTRLRQQELVEGERRVLTNEGRNRLRAAFGLSRAPTWKEMPVHAAAVALGFTAGSIEAQRALASAATLQATILADQFGLERRADVRSLCEQLIFARLGLPAFAIRDTRLLIRMLAQHAGAKPTAKLEQLAAQLAARAVGARDGSKATLIRMLARRWASETPAEPVIRSEPAFADSVRAAIGRVPASGRYGIEKVFIVSLWDAMKSDAAKGMDLARFKQRLVEANAHQDLVLARADLVGAMDPVQVAQSEIVDRGASFHFVLDVR